MLRVNNFYVSKSIDLIKLVKINITPNGTTKRPNSMGQDSLNLHLILELMKCAKFNSKFRQLKKDLDLDRSDKVQLKKIIQQNIGNEKKWYNFRDVMQKWKLINSQTCWYFNEIIILEIIYLSAFKKLSFVSIWEKFNINDEELQNIFRKFLIGMHSEKEGKYRNK